LDGLSQGRVGSVYLPKAPRHNDVLTVHYISLLERTRYYRAFITSLPLGTAASIIFWSLLLNKNRAISIAMRCAVDMSMSETED
jgi:hypothetical protein